MFLFHLELSDPSVSSTSEEHNGVWEPPEHLFTFAEPISGQNRLSTSFSRTGDVMRQRGSELDLQSTDVADRETEDSTGYHHHPESAAIEGFEAGDIR